jgi:hypothetical protein
VLEFRDAWSAWCEARTDDENEALAIFEFDGSPTRRIFEDRF